MLWDSTAQTVLYEQHITLRRFLWQVVDTFADARQNDMQNLAEEMEDATFQHSMMFHCPSVALEELTNCFVSIFLWQTK